MNPLRRNRLNGAVLLGAALASLGWGAYHRTPLSEPGSTNLPPDLLATNFPLQRVSENVYTIGLVRMDKKERTASFPGSVNMSDGVVEYALVHSTGKVHESVLKTETDPLHIHLAMLLLGPTNPPATDANGLPRELVGPKLRIWVNWTSSPDGRVPLEDLVSNTVTRAAMSRGHWVYSGSRVVQGVFLAHRDGSIAAIISDPDALINSPRPGRDDDEIWRSNSALVPPVGTPVQITLQFTDSL
jgi:hypothetical protein